VKNLFAPPFEAWLPKREVQDVCPRRNLITTADHLDVFGDAVKSQPSLAPTRWMPEATSTGSTNHP